ncbi:hypothetical protein EDD18DRAFT_744927 [Armillaria luteobubalina]|uniref:Uncharacterized protein n=1 Tax=Armillaria luteobubalina TaxID=153913 RepID=A0AA39QHH3_9AGAR|nr:hypothetical protein EDD18DRAFT_744927 [Armillaria luteobubalina]
MARYLFSGNILMSLISILICGSFLPCGSAQTQSEQPCSQRTIFNILWSSLVTIFACVWIAIHPNVPGPKLAEQGWFFTSVLRRTELTIVTVFAPEVTTIWAFRQFFVAWNICNLLPKSSPKTLTLSHGFLVSMGAFVYSDGCPITRQNLGDNPVLLLQLAEIPKKDIDDRNKGDGLSKGLAMLQATWFVIHCIARLVNHLPVTIIETVAIGYAVFTVINYALWWHKPLGIEVPFRATVASPDTADVTPLPSPPGLIPRKLGKEYLLDWVDIHLSSTFFGGDVTDDLPPSKEEGVPRLWSGHENNLTLFYVVTSGGLFGTIFGAIHCAAWNSHFPTSIERILWRVSSLYIALIPAPVVILTFTAEKLADHFGLDVPGQDNFWFGHGYRLLWMLLYSVYIVARAFLLLEPFLAMRSFSYGAYEDISWTDFLPHV